ncbi:MAG TPA: protein kinase [Thermoanaerobaculia bacterium]|nr:protein kinase [Thermoanaerobaculia bacterium]
MREGDPERALKAYARAKDWRRAAQLAAELGHEDKLVEYSLMAAFGRLPEKGLGVLQAAELLTRQGRHEEAIPLFEKKKAFHRAGDLALGLRQHERAAQFFKQAGAWPKAARCYEEVGKLREALQVLEEGVRKLEGGSGGNAAAGSSVEDLKLLEADLLIRLGRGESVPKVLSSMRPSPRIAELYERSGLHTEAVRCLLDLGRVEEAVRTAAKSPQRERLQAQIYLRIGRPVEAGDLFAQLGLAREAAQAYEAGQAWGRAAYRWEAAGEPLRAAEAYEKADRLRDAGRCFEAANQHQRAAEVYARAGDVAQAASIHVRKGQAVQAARKYLAAGDQVRAASVLIQMQPAEADYAEGAILLAPLLIAEKFHEDALARLERIPRGGIPAGGTPPLAVEHDYWRARALEALGRSEAAVASYERVVQRLPGHRDARQRLETLRPSTLALPALPKPLPERAAALTVPAPGGQLANRYELLAEVGRGGMGRVYKARDRELGEIVAVKTMLTRSEGGSGDEERLLREVQICRRISHPNVVRVYDLGRFPGGLFVTMEYIEGSSLDELIAFESPLPFARIRSILSEIASGLHEAHSQGVVHRDLKPANVFVAADRVKILDFGIASMTGLGTRLTQVGFVMGTPMYMSPEQIQGQELDGRSDLYSLGVLAYTLIAGREPFDSTQATVVVLQHLQEGPPDVRKHRPETPESWVALLARLLEKRPEDRFQSAQELLGALEDLTL